MNAKHLGEQYIIELYGCTKELLDDQIFIEKILSEAAVIADAHIVQTYFHQFSPQGISGTIVISESHMNIHTWPEHGYAAIDLFTCGSTLKPQKAMDYLAKELSAKKYTLEIITRGLKENLV